MNRTVLNPACITGAAMAMLPAAASGQYVPFRGLGDLPGGAFATRAWDLTVTVTGPIVVGESMSADGWRAFRWTLGSGMQDLGVLSPSDTFSRATSVHAAGSVIVGSSGFAPAVYECQGFQWTAQGGMQAIGPFAAPITASLPYSVSVNAAGGSAPVIVGQAGMTPGSPFGFYHTSAGIFPIGTLPGGSADNSAAHDVNSGLIVGYARDAALQMVAVRWTQSGGLLALGHLNTTGFKDSRAYACSWLGTIVGESTSPNGPQEAFRWKGEGLVGLGDLPSGEFRSVALAVTDNTPIIEPEIIVGWGSTGDGPRAFMWDQNFGMRDLKQVLLNRGWNVQGWTLTSAVAISGKLVAGNGINPAGQPEGWIANLRCYPDCNGDEAIHIGDFPCFQSQFVAGAPYADCNGDGVRTIADFSCFQTKFVLSSVSGCQ